MGDVLRNWYHEAEHALSGMATAVLEHRSISLEPLEDLATGLVSSLQRKDELVVQALAGASGSPLITNLINVAILGTKVGTGLGYYGEELHQLALAGLVHDIGLFAVPRALISKSGRLTQEERELIERHPELGYQVVERCGPTYRWLAQLTRQAHERFNGQGYPNRLAGRAISEMALILGVVDVFDALVSERPYRCRLLPYEAIKELLVAERRTFPREILKALVEQFSMYPLGTTVRLTTGEVGTVTNVNSRYPLRPVVRMDDRQGCEASGACEIDLSRTPVVSIAEILQPPVVGRIVFSEAPSKPVASLVPTTVSDSFTSLLESLDAVALTLQGVVDSKKASLKLPDVDTDVGAMTRTDCPFH